MHQNEQNVDRLALAVKADPTDSAAFSLLHEAFSSLIRKKAESFVAPDDPRVLEIASEMTVALLDAAKSFDAEKGGFRAFAVKCMNNRALDCLKSRGKENPVDPTSDTFTQIASDEDIEADLAGRESLGTLLSKAKTYLSPFEFEVLKLLSKGFTNPEIAKCLAVDKKSVENAKSRIKTKSKANGIGN